VLTTFPADGDVDALASALVGERLAACVNVVPVHSIYRWQGAIERADERQLFIKTTAERVAVLKERVKALHPYEVPEFIVLTVATGTAEYLSWLAENSR
jgi:periplasmic divalent cation tolerance protein